MITCGYCGCRGCLGEFAYVSPAFEAGPASLRRCPACKGFFVVDPLEVEEAEASPDAPWGLSDIWGRRFTGKKREV